MINRFSKIPSQKWTLEATETHHRGVRPLLVECLSDHGGSDSDPGKDDEGAILKVLGLDEEGICGMCAKFLLEMYHKQRYPKELGLFHIHQDSLVRP